MLFTHMKYLVELAHHRHFGRAAAACFVSQPALSAAIRKLEHEYRVPIVERSNKFLGFTPEGEIIVRFARQLVAEHDALSRSISTLREGVGGRLRIGAIPTTLSSISLLTGPFARAHPFSSISVTSMTSTAIERGLQEFDLDVGLTYTDNEPLRGVHRQPLYRETYVLLTAADGRFAHRESITWAEAAHEPLCLLSPDMQNRRILDEAFRSVGREPRTCMETNSITALFSHVRTGGGSAITSHTWLHLYPVPDHLRALPLVEPHVSQEVGLVVPDRGPESLLTTAFRRVAEGVDVEGELALGRVPVPQR